MKRHFTKGMSLGIVAIVFIVGLLWAAAIPADKAEEIAKYVANMIIAGRGVVASHQSLINDPSKGDKGFTPEYVEKKMKERFREITGKSVEELDPEARAVVEQVIEAAKMSVKMNQTRINQKGKGFKMYIPAVFGRETGQILKSRSDIVIKQTTFKYRNSYNQPDEFEKKVLTMFSKPDWPKGKGYGEKIGSIYRYLQPIYIKKPCLKCHGEPAGELDIAGRKKEGYKLGDLRGAISVMFPVK
ncbi:MAG TPA: DUF3365 domain-containing protein [Dissulfuribacter thermophilus]|uniref:DUF3365 domain-containing protein n=1 Tax=Dissulfuribacter thermophilus TaxID=1156395 RepID=A0A7V2WSW8_9BACT|nr:DUF3365 domain-containing protein [Dissulfuribacter thermophilus]